MKTIKRNRCPPTEGIKYAGSKRKLLPSILELTSKTGARTVLDGFAGTTRVSQAFARSGFQVASNDLNTWSKVFGICYLKCDRPASAFSELIDHLNNVSPKEGWFTENYGGRTDEKEYAEDGSQIKRPWQRDNARKIDGIRDEIDRLQLPEIDRAIALTSLMLAMDQVDSTMGHFVSYLKDWSPRSYQPIELKVPLVEPNEKKHQVTQKDVFEVAQQPVDLAYFDPPYGSNNEKMPPSRVRYASYYHVWTTVCLNDQPDLFGKAQRRTDSSDKVALSVFEEFRRNPETQKYLAVEAIEKLMSITAAKWILLSYSSGGRATAEELRDSIAGIGQIAELVEVDYQRNVMASMKWTNDWTRKVEQPNREYLFLIEKSG